MKSAKERIELTLIYLVAAFFTISVIGLVDHQIQTSAVPDPYPNLYAGPPQSEAVSAEKTLYLTFDDGPSHNTERILDILAEYGAKGTFFITAQEREEAYIAPLLERITKEGHSIGLHSYTHDFSEIYQSADTYLQDLDRLNDYIYETVQIRPDIFRFPGGSATINASRQTIDTLIEELDRRGYQYFDWDVVSGDETATVYPPEDLAIRMIDGIRKKDTTVVLMHDNAGPVTTPDAVELVLRELQPEGYSFQALSGDVEPVHIIRG